MKSSIPNERKAHPRALARWMTRLVGFSSLPSGASLVQVIRVFEHSKLGNRMSGKGLAIFIDPAFPSSGIYFYPNGSLTSLDKLRLYLVQRLSCLIVRRRSRGFVGWELTDKVPPVLFRIVVGENLNSAIN